MSETIVFGGGCFWCVDAVFRRLRGVSSVLSGYAGGVKENPTYFAVSGGTTGHAEVLQVVYETDVISLSELLSVFFSTHDPTSLNRQGNDVGPEYRSAIYYSTESQAQTIKQFIEQLESDHTFAKPIVTEVKPLEKFYPAEEYHQAFYEKNPDQPYCQFVIDPKIAKLRKQFAHLLKEE